VNEYLPAIIIIVLSFAVGISWGIINNNKQKEIDKIPRLSNKQLEDLNILSGLYLSNQLLVEKDENGKIILNFPNHNINQIIE